MAHSQLGDFYSLTTNDGQVLTLPNRDLTLVDMGGFGAAPVQWITKQGYKQNGETEVGYNLLKRPLSLHLHYAKACSRAQYWANRSTIHDFLRHNRLGPLTLTVVQGGQDNTQPQVFQNSGDTVVSFPGGLLGNRVKVNNIAGTDFWGRSPRFQIGYLIQIDQEQMLVSNINATTEDVTVTRGINGTPTTHANGTGILSALYPYVTNTGHRQRSIIVRADPGMILDVDADREANWYLDESIKFVAFNPIWFDPAQNVIAVSQLAQQFLIFPITFPIQFGVGGIQFSATIPYAGTWYEYPIITLTGPYQSAVISNVSTGVSFTMNVPLIAGQQRIINTTLGNISITDQTGANFFGELGPNSDLVDFNLRPSPEVLGGINTIQVNMIGAAAGSATTLSYYNRYFGI